MTETLIKIENLHKNFGKNEVLKGIDLEIKKGEVVVIIGPSGSGKSTLLRSMNLLEEATKGKVIFEGVDITDKKNDLFGSESYIVGKRIQRFFNMLYLPLSQIAWIFQWLKSTKLGIIVTRDTRPILLDVDLRGYF